MDINDTQFEAQLTSANQVYIPKQFRKKHKMQVGEIHLFEYKGHIIKQEIKRLEEANDTKTSPVADNDGNGK